MGEPVDGAQSFVIPSYLTLQHLLEQYVSTNQALTRIYQQGETKFTHFQQDITDHKAGGQASPLVILDMHESISELPLKRDRVVWLVYSKPSPPNQNELQVGRFLEYDKIEI